MAAAVHANLSLPSGPPSPPDSPQEPLEPDTSPLVPRLIAVVSRTWDLGFTSFGGPPVHFTILHRRFVQIPPSSADNTSRTKKPRQLPWLDEQTFQELFAICQALPGPASTKMLFCIVLLHAGVAAAFLAFCLWSLPAALAMYGLALGVGNMAEVLPGPVYALLTGLNASTVGVVALAAVQLAEKAAKDRLTRLLVVWGGCAGLCYTALWYFPVLIVVGGVFCAVWELWAARMVERVKRKWLQKRRRGRLEAAEAGNSTAAEVGQSVEMTTIKGESSHGVQRRKRASEEDRDKHQATAESSTHGITAGNAAAGSTDSSSSIQRQEEMASGSTATPPTKYYDIAISTGIGLIALTFAIFIALVVSRSLLPDPPRPLSVLASMYQAGILIFGGGPVVIPLLRDYVVDPGWVSSRDFLIGLAIIQAMPGPNFNFSVYLGALAMARSGFHSALGALLGFVGIFAPGLLLTMGVQGMWAFLRTRPAVVSVLRGINATAVGLVFTAVYRLWEIGYLTPEDSRGRSLALEPWWVVVAALTYAEVAYFSVPPAVAIVAGAVLGLCWFGAVSRG